MLCSSSHRDPLCLCAQNERPRQLIAVLHPHNLSKVPEAAEWGWVCAPCPCGSASSLLPLQSVCEPCGPGPWGVQTRTPKERPPACGIDPTCGESISAGQVLPVSFSVVNSDHPLLVNSGCQARPREPQGCHRGVGTREAKSQFASGGVFCRTCYCGRSHSSSLGLVCSGTSRIHTAEKRKAIICLLTYAKGRWDVTSSEAEH